MSPHRGGGDGVEIPDQALGPETSRLHCVRTVGRTSNQKFWLQKFFQAECLEPASPEKFQERREGLSTALITIIMVLLKRSFPVPFLRR